jgi:hypothetical protein
MLSDAPRLQPSWLDPQRPREGRYVLGPLLGQGGMGEVREAWDVVLCRTVALKLLRKLDPSSLIRFLHEARLQSRLAHPNVCQIFDVESSEAAPRIAMQLVRGPTLADAAPDLAVADIVRIVAQVAGAVHAAHRRKLIHRDLKPSNILLEPDPEGGWTPYVCDFGLALDLDGPAMAASPWVQGTPAYMAPEQLQEDPARIGPATDVFALGGTLHFALRGELPGGPRLAPDPNGGRPPKEVPRDLDLIIRKCLEPDPERRYPTAKALGEDLGRFLRGEPIAARGGKAQDDRWRRWSRVWKPALGVLLAGTCLAAALAQGQKRLAASFRSRSTWEHHFTREAAEMERDLLLERALPAHDLRPAYARLRVRLEGIVSRLATLGPEAQGPGHYALGQGQFLLGDFGSAQRELELARGWGFREPEAAGLLALTLVAAQARTEPEALFAGEPEDPVPPQGATPVEALLDPAGEPAPDSFTEAQAAFSRQDYARAAELARMDLVTRPWQAQAGVLASTSLAILGRQACLAGDDLLAETRYFEAMVVAQRCLEQARSDESLHHACLAAGRGLAALRLDRGAPAADFLAQLRQAVAQALDLNPDNPELQDDWLGLRILEARRLAAKGREPGTGGRPALLRRPDPPSPQRGPAGGPHADPLAPGGLGLPSRRRPGTGPGPGPGRCRAHHLPGPGLPGGRAEPQGPGGGRPGPGSPTRPGPGHGLHGAGPGPGLRRAPLPVRHRRPHLDPPGRLGSRPRPGSPPQPGAGPGAGRAGPGGADGAGGGGAAAGRAETEASGQACRLRSFSGRGLARRRSEEKVLSSLEEPLMKLEKWRQRAATTGTRILTEREIVPEPETGHILVNSSHDVSHGPRAPRPACLPA